MNSFELNFYKTKHNQLSNGNISHLDVTALSANIAEYFMCTMQEKGFFDAVRESLTHNAKVTQKFLTELRADNDKITPFVIS